MKAHIFVTPAPLPLSITVILVVSFLVPLSLKASESSNNQEFTRLLQAYSEFAEQVRQSPSAELVSSPSTEHYSRMQQLDNNLHYTAPELKRFAQDAQNTYCEIITWAGGGYQEQRPIIHHRIADQEHRIAMLQRKFYSSAALFVVSETHHTNDGLTHFGREAKQQIEGLWSLVLQKIQQQQAS